MIPTISQACSMHTDFATDIEEYAAGGCRSIEVWLTKLEAYLQGHTIEEAKALLEQYGVTCPAASFQGGLFQPRGSALDGGVEPLRAAVGIVPGYDQLVCWLWPVTSHALSPRRRSTYFPTGPNRLMQQPQAEVSGSPSNLLQRRVS